MMENENVTASPLKSPNKSHTPTPWSIVGAAHKSSGYLGGFTVPIRCGEMARAGNPVCVVHMGGPGALQVDEASVMANAEFIVKAVNYHEKLVQIMNAFISSAITVRDEQNGDCDMDVDMDSFSNALEDACGFRDFLNGSDSEPSKS